MIERQKSQRWVNSVPTYGGYEDDYCYENDNEHIAGKSTSHEESPQGQPEINSSSEPEQNDYEEVVHTSGAQHLVSLMSQPANDSNYIRPGAGINETVVNFEESPHEQHEQQQQQQPQKEEEKESLVDPVVTNKGEPTETNTTQEQARLVLSVDQQEIGINADDIDSFIDELNNFDSRRWTPNTDKFCNQFINYNNSESINYSPNSSLAEEISISKSSAVSKTIHVGSVLKDHNYQKPLFREERLTPAASDDDFSTQKYHSLIPPDIRVASDSSETTERKRSVSTSTMNTDATVNITPKITSPPLITTPGKYPVSDWKSIITISQPQDRIAAFKEALLKEQEYDSGIQMWLNYALKQEPTFNSNLLIGRVASQAYQNAPHNDLRRHVSLRTKVNLVKDKVEGTTGSFGKTTGSLGKTTASLGKTIGELGIKVFARGRNLFKLPKGTDNQS